MPSQAKVLRVKVDGQMYPVKVARTREEINVGMLAYDTPPPYGILFLLKGRYSNITTVGMKFDLRVWLVDSSWNVVRRMMLVPGQNVPLEQNVYAMIEIPAV